MGNAAYNNYNNNTHETPILIPRMKTPSVYDRFGNVINNRNPTYSQRFRQGYNDNFAHPINRAVYGKNPYTNNYHYDEYIQQHPYGGKTLHRRHKKHYRKTRKHRK
jgi:hypothetical protein